MTIRPRYLRRTLPVLLGLGVLLLPGHASSPAAPARSVATHPAPVRILAGGRRTATPSHPRGGARPLVAQDVQTITITGGDPGRTFDGVGTISAGGESRLFQDYPITQQNEILDYMFCNPDPTITPTAGYCTQGIYGASPQEFKVEIGGETNSSVGAEPSFLRTRAEYTALRNIGPTTDTCHLNRGYEWRLMREAKARNPNIIFSALSWGAPGWIGADTYNNSLLDNYHPHGYFYSQDMINYDIAFAQCAQFQGTPLSYLGIWNETPYKEADPTYPDSLYQQDIISGTLDNTQWIKDLRSALNMDPDPVIRNIKIVVRDAAGGEGCGPVCDGWDVIGDISGTGVLSPSVAAVGVHYYGGQGPIDTIGFTVPVTVQAFAANNPAIPLWITEQGPLNFPGQTTAYTGAQMLAQIYTRSYIEGKITKELIVGALNGYYDSASQHPEQGVRLPGNGMIDSNTPWSGYYNVLPAVWVTAHVTQFTQPQTWRYIDSASCLFGDATLGNNVCATPPITQEPPVTETRGSFVTLREITPTNPLSVNWTVIAETHNGTPRTVHVCPVNGMATPATLQVWATTQTSSFISSTIPLTGSCYTATLLPESIYTFTTLTTGHKGTVNTSCNNNCPNHLMLPYSEDFGMPYTVGTTPRYFADQEGAFQIGDCGGAQPLCLTQVITQPSIPWSNYLRTPNSSHPSTLIGEQEGDQSWSDYSMSVQVRIDGDQYDGSRGYAALLGRYGPYVQFKDGNGLTYSTGGGYELRLYNRPDGKGNMWEFSKNSVVLDSGPCPMTCAEDTWHTLAISITGTTDPVTITLTIDNTSVGTVVDSGPVFLHGAVGLETGWNQADFRTLRVLPNPK